MTPAQLEHLKLIDSHLERLLAIAEKRTSGDWTVHNSTYVESGGDIVAYCLLSETRSFVAKRDGANNATFIASCAGNAEAGWRATRAAIALLFAMCDGAHSINTVIAAQKMGESILVTFPLELIQKP